MNEKEVVWAKIDELREDAVKFLQELIKRPSPNPPGDEKDVADFCANYMRDMGMDVQQIEPYPRRVSNIGRLSGKVGKPVLLFNSHLDNMPVGDLRNLRFPPYAGIIHEDCIYGQGASNMKTGAASALFAIKALKECKVQLSGDVLITETADELHGGNKGLRVLVDRGLVKSDWGVYTEAHPSAHYGKDYVEIGSRGLVNPEITVYGRKAHTTKKEKGINAILKMAKVAEAIDKMEFRNWKPHPTIEFGDIKGPVISVNKIDAFLAHNYVPDKCTILCDCRTIPPQSTEDVIDNIKRVLDELMAEDPDLKVEISGVAQEGRAWWVETDAYIAKAMQQAIKEVTGKSLDTIGTSSTSDARWLRWDANIPMCKFVFMDVIPVPEKKEYLDEIQPIDRYIDTIKVFATLMLNLLGTEVN